MFTQEDLPMIALTIIEKEKHVQQLRETYHIHRCGTYAAKWRKLLNEEQKVLSTLKLQREWIIKRYGLKED